MKTISIINQKGKCGKTTIAINLAICFKLYKKKRVILFDIDPQLRAWKILQRRDTSDKKLGIIKIEIDVHKKIYKYARDYDYAIIDAPPHDNMTVRPSVICSDMVIIPIQASPLDIQNVQKIIDLINIAKEYNPNIRSYFLLSRIQPNNMLAKDLKEFLQKIYPEINILKTTICNRIVYQQSILYGQSVIEFEKIGAASKEIKNLAYELLK